NPSHSARSLGEQLGLSQRQVERVLAKLKKDGTIKRTGSNKSGSWQVIK
ncbi:winged helix-turn-helix transcriptional regulator, partial [uncultured Dubosiella sp.]